MINITYKTVKPSHLKKELQTYLPETHRPTDPPTIYHLPTDRLPSNPPTAYHEITLKQRPDSKQAQYSKVLDVVYKKTDE